MNTVLVQRAVPGASSCWMVFCQISKAWPFATVWGIGAALAVAFFRAGADARS